MHNRINDGALAHHLLLNNYKYGKNGLLDGKRPREKNETFREKNERLGEKKEYSHPLF